MGDEENWLLWPDKPKFFNSFTLVHHKSTPKGKSKQEINVCITKQREYQYYTKIT